MSALNVALALGAGAILLLGLISGYIKNRLWLSEPLLATLLGIAVGPAVFDFAVVEIADERESVILREVARVTLALSVMGAALRLPSAYEAGHWRELVVILGLGMPLIPDEVRERIVQLALDEPELSPRELAERFTDTESYFVSEASVYRLLKAHDLITSPAFVVMKAVNEFKDKTTAPRLQRADRRRPAGARSAPRSDPLDGNPGSRRLKAHTARAWRAAPARR
jgi:hypothetical protein